MPRNEISLDSTDYVLDARPDRIDHRDRPYQPPLISLPSRWPTERDIALALPYFSALVDDQGTEGACTGFGLAAVINFVIWRDTVLRLPRSDRGLLAIDLDQAISPAVSPYQLYHLARTYDEWEGEDYEGSSCRGAVKGYHKHGACLKSLWPEKKPPTGEARSLWQADAASRPLGAYYRIDRLSINDLQAAIYEVGAVYASAKVHGGWKLSSSPDKLPVIRRAPMAPHIGAHSFAIIGYESRGFIVQNSWGGDWGYYGFAILPYDDWAHSALDAWVAVMGAPTSVAADHVDDETTNTGVMQAMTLHSYRKDSLSLATTRNPGWFWGRSDSGERTVSPLSREEAYGLTVVLENDGRPLRRRVGFESVGEALEEIVHQLPKRWFQNFGEEFGDTLKLMVFFHGGLNSETDSLRRIEKMAPYFLANGIYPLFITWRTSFRDSITGILEDSLQRFFRPPTRADSLGWREAIREQVSEATDRAIEVACQQLLVKPIWTQMKQNAQAAIARDRGMYLVAQSIEKLFGELGGGELHLIGHSAGSLPIGHLLRRLQTRSMSVQSCRLFAPACTTDFANDHFGRAFEREVLSPDDFYLHVLSDKLERDDNISRYGKSLLYLVSRALEINHKEPLLGLEYLHQTDPAQVPNDFWHIPMSRREGDRVNPDVQRWQENFLPLIPTKNITVHTETDVVTRVGSHGTSDTIRQTHGSFDNNIGLLTKCISQIRGKEANPKVTDLHDQ
ncbi:hypothetical protein RISK_000569 [Rhodopirellula islandica]|uniref:Uncharacterized protein n=1 Tax=Rhodopirellula islandica TaxID=595434 RepID=A0A0J1BLT9_RHOIS|nr:C1 family peptidase [Rhodopirellula islandica]KLU07491.1 hypothetical protein RISK_000569 [Rhodopirellula islandica]